MTVISPGLYGMVDTEFGPPLDIAEALLRSGCTVLQLRAKGLSTDARVTMARALLPRVRAANAVLLVNDDIEAAHRSGAHGVHLGQSDGTVQDAREKLGPHAIVGLSTHTLNQVLSVGPDVDYIGFGPVFSTTTKVSTWATVGIERLRAACVSSPVPVVAIGGIRLHHLPELQAAGAQHWAVISDILSGTHKIDVWSARAAAFCLNP